MNFLKTSLSSRLSLYIILFTGVLFLCAMLTFHLFSQAEIKREATQRSRALLKTIELRVEHIAYSVEQSLEDLSDEIDDHIEYPDTIPTLIRRTLKGNPMIEGAIVAFEPYYYPNKGHLYAPYVHRAGDTLQCIYVGSDKYNYLDMEWYIKPKQSGLRSWSPPYFDRGAAERAVTTLSIPLYDHSGKFYGVCTADISLEWLSNVMTNTKPYPNAETFVKYGRGDYLVSPLTDDGIDRTSGKEKIIFQGIVDSTRWIVGIICTTEDVYKGLYQMNLFIIIILAAGLITLFFVCRYIIKRETKPLKELEKVAGMIAAGNFHSPLPDVRYPDEIFRLRDTLGFMQTSLLQYIEEQKRSTAYKERIDEELRIASRIQSGILISQFPKLDQLQLYAMQKPALEVGGDLYDFFIHKNKLYFIIGDVSGKGIPAALYMTVTIFIFRAVGKQYDCPGKLVELLNSVISSYNERNNMFITFLAGILDMETGELSFCNAGHNPPILKTASATSMLSLQTNIPLGVTENYNYHTEKISLEDNSTLITYTDGVTESENTEHELYGLRLLQTVKTCNSNDAHTLVETIIDDVHKHSEGAPQADDLTLLIMKWNKKE